MNLWKRIASVSLMFTMLILSVLVMFISSMLTSKSITTYADKDGIESRNGLTVKCKGGTILHAWNWYFKDVTDNMEEIAKAGYTSVQVSPIQKQKEVDGGLPNLIKWWTLYQPVNFKIGNILGTREEFKEMCNKAHECGVKIIVDVISNHLANESDEEKYKISSQVEEKLRENKDFWHNIEEDVNDNNRFDMTQKSLGMPDLNTGNTELQSIITDFLHDCQECGAYGFRFDAAKHIELPKDMDGDFGSDYWPNIVTAIKTKDRDAFIYGEVLRPIATKEENYAKFMHITADKHGSNVRDAVAKGIAGCAWDFGSGISSDKLVTWVESHDTYVTNKDYGISANLTDTQIRLGWSLAAGRAGVTPLFFVRPNCDLKGRIGGPGNELWKDPTVEAINKFHNEMSGKGEYVRTPNNDVFVVERGADAAILTNISKSKAEINIETTLKEGFYWDEISGSKPENSSENKFYVKEDNGKRYLTGTINPESTAILRIAVD